MEKYTVTPAALYETFDPVKAKALWDRFEFIRTVKMQIWSALACDSLAPGRSDFAMPVISAAKATMLAFVWSL